MELRKCHAQSLPKGYKQTEIGIIPSEWDLVRIGECFEFKNGLNKEKEYFGQGTPIVNYMDVFKHSGIESKDITGLVTLSNAEIKNYEVKKGDVFFTRTSETVDEIGISTVALDEMNNTVFSGFVLRGRPKNDRICLEFKKYCFAATIVRKQIISTASYTTRALTNGRVLSNVLLPLPTISEQTAIATALSDADALISSLEKLIEKKRNIKQGAMQELLKPKTGWVVKKLGEICEVEKGEQLNRATLSESDIYPVLNGGVAPSGYTNVFNQNENTIIISEGGNSCGFVNFIKTKFWQGGHCYSLKTKLNHDFVFQALKFYEKTIMALRVGSGLPNIQRSRLITFEISIPKSEAEQKEIATFLSDMDNEIASLEKKLSKRKMLKQGMMQELLTGKIRLV